MKKILVCALCLTMLLSLNTACFAESVVIYDYSNGNSYINYEAEAEMIQTMLEYQEAGIKGEIFPFSLITDLFSRSTQSRILSQALAPSIVTVGNSVYLDTTITPPLPLCTQK